MTSKNAADPAKKSPGVGLLRPVRGWITLAALFQAGSAILVLAPLLGVTELARVLMSTHSERAAEAWYIVKVSAFCLGGG